MKSNYSIKKVSLSAITITLLLFLFSCAIETTEDEIINSTMTKDSLEKLNSSVGVDWQVKSVTNLTLSKRWGGGWDSLDIADPCIIKMGENDYKMWYSGKGPYGDGIGLWRIGYATSKDGKSWQKDYENNAVLAPNKENDKDGVRVISVIYDESEKLYKMWYRGYYGDQVNIFYAYSKQPNRGWIKFPNDEFSKDGNPEPVIKIGSSINDTLELVGSGALIKETHYITPYMKQSNYNFWYVLKAGDDYRIKYLYSANGMKWPEGQSTLPVFEERKSFFKSGTAMPTVIKDYYEEQPVYKMWFVGLEYDAQKKVYSRQLGLNYCFNYGIKFVYFDKSNTFPPLIAPGELSPYDDKGFYGLNVIRDGNKYKMWYVGVGATDVPTICYRESINY